MELFCLKLMLTKSDVCGLKICIILLIYFDNVMLSGMRLFSVSFIFHDVVCASVHEKTAIGLISTCTVVFLQYM